MKAIDDLRGTARNGLMYLALATGAGGCAMTQEDLQDLAIGVAGAALGAKLETQGKWVGAAAVRGATNQYLNRENAEATGEAIGGAINNVGSDLQTYTCVSNGIGFITYRDENGDYRGIKNNVVMHCDRVY